MFNFFILWLLLSYICTCIHEPACFVNTHIYIYTWPCLPASVNIYLAVPVSINTYLALPASINTHTHIYLEMLSYSAAYCLPALLRHIRRSHAQCIYNLHHCNNKKHFHEVHKIPLSPNEITQRQNNNDKKNLLFIAHPLSTEPWKEGCHWSKQNSWLDEAVPNASKSNKRIQRHSHITSTQKKNNK